MSETKLSNIYYNPKGYWKDLAAIQKLAEAGKVAKKVADDWLQKQALWQVYLPAPRCIPRPKFDVPTPNKVHQADLRFLPHDTLGRGRGRKTYKFALTVVDVANRYKEAEPLTSKDVTEIAGAFNVFTIVARCGGQSFCKSIRDVSSWVLFPKL